MKRLLFLLLIGFMLTTVNDINAQDCEKENFLMLGDLADKEMLRHYNSKKFASAIESCSEKVDYYFQAESWPKYIKALNDKAFLYKLIDDLTALKELVFVNFEEAEKYLQSDHPEWLRSKEQINSYYYLIGDYKNSLEIIKEVAPIKEKLNVSKLEIANTYLNLGAAYRSLKDSENALSSFKKSVNILNEDKKYDLSKGERYNYIARVFQLKGELDSALYYLDLSEKLFDDIIKKSRFKGRKVITYIILVEIWLEKKDFKKAKHYLDKIKSLQLNNREIVTWNERNARYQREIGNYEEAKKSILKASEIAEKFNTRNSPPSRARRKIELVKTLIKNNEKDEALKMSQEGLQILAPTFKENDIHLNPKSEFFLDKPDALTFLQNKARILFEKYENLNDLNFLKSSFNTYQVACNVIKDVRQGIRSSDSKNDLSKKTISVYEEAINAAHNLFEKTGDAIYLDEIFKLAESNKAQLLLENFNEQKARGFAGIPDSLSEKEKGLRLYLAALEDRAVREGRNPDNDDEIFSVREEVNQFSSILEKSYPRYFQLKYNNEPIGPSIVQDQLLDESTALIEYFMGMEKIYVFVITKNNFLVDVLEKGTLEIENISKLRNILKNRPGSESPETEYSNFIEASHSVYNSFVKGAIDKLPESINTLIIIPDDQINYIPFEVLLLEDPKSNSSYSLESQSYLFEDYAVNYNYSATLLNKVMSKNASDFKANFIGYAPTFTGISDNSSRSALSFELSKLKCNKDEVSTIKAIIGGEERISEDATKENFLKEVNDYKIVHLATHAFVNQNDSKLNRIFLQDDFLSDVNLYNLELNTEMAVLSACNTGSGELLKGEGVMNLARGFINAGCSSTLMSMWSVDDCATADLMRLFYVGIKDGLQKDEALQKAKIEYLNSAKKTKLHPYYWAAFIPFGDMQSMELNEAGIMSFNTSIGILIGIFLLVLFYFFRIKESK